MKKRNTPPAESTLRSGSNSDLIAWNKYYPPEDLDEICDLRKDFDLPCTGCFMYKDGKCLKGTAKHYYYKIN